MSEDHPNFGKCDLCGRNSFLFMEYVVCCGLAELCQQCSEKEHDNRMGNKSASSDG